MADYAVLEDGGGSILVVWLDSAGRHAVPLVDLTEGDVRRLARCLEGVSHALWTAYAEREGFDPEESAREVREAISKPHPPGIVSYDPIVEWSHRLGRELDALSEQPRERLVQEVETELDAVWRATLGDLTGRAAQASVASRREASPTQVAAAHRILRDDALGRGDLKGLRDLEPAAAAVAAAYWLVAAAVLCEDISEVDATMAALEADNVEAIDVEAATAVLNGVLDMGMSEEEAVGSLLGSEDPADLRDALLEAYEVVLELIAEYTHEDEDGTPVIGDIRVPPPPGLTWRTDIDEEDEEYIEAMSEAVRAELRRRTAGIVRSP